jgi:hypothetical protein
VDQLTFFFDRCLGKRLPQAVQLAGAPFRVEYFHDPKSPFNFKHDTPDDVWIPAVAKQGWFILSHDNQWHKNESENLAIKQHAAGCFYLYGSNSLTWYKLRALMKASDKIMDFARKTPRPFVFRAGGNGRMYPIKL